MATVGTVAGSVDTDSQCKQVACATLFAGQSDRDFEAECLHKAVYVQHKAQLAEMPCTHMANIWRQAQQTENSLIYLPFKQG